MTEGEAAVSGRVLPSLEGVDDVARAGCAELAGLLKVGLWNFLGIEGSEWILASKDCY